MFQNASKGGNIAAFGELVEQLELDPDSFEEFSHERTLWDQYVAQKMREADELAGVSGSDKKIHYYIPRMTENPVYNRNMLRQWIKEFHEYNGMSLPKGFYRKDKFQLVGMFNGMRRTYKISLDQIIYTG